MLSGGVSDACSFRTHAPLYYLLFFLSFLWGRWKVEASSADFFVCKDLRSVLTKQGELFLVSCSGKFCDMQFFCEKSDGFSGGFCCPSKRRPCSGERLFYKTPPPQCYECKEMISY